MKNVEYQILEDEYIRLLTAHREHAVHSITFDAPAEVAAPIIHSVFTSVPADAETFVNPPRDWNEMPEQDATVVFRHWDGSEDLALDYWVTPTSGRRILVRHQILPPLFPAQGSRDSIRIQVDFPDGSREAAGLLLRRLAEAQVAAVAYNKSGEMDGELWQIKTEAGWEDPAVAAPDFASASESSPARPRCCGVRGNWSP